MGTRISQLPPANKAEITSNVDFVIQTEKNQTKRAKFSQISELLTSEQQFFKIEIPSKRVQNSNSSPIELLAAPGAGRYIHSIDCSILGEYAGSKYSSHTDIEIGCPSATIPQMKLDGGLGYQLDSFKQLQKVISSSGADTQMIENEPLQFSVKNGNPSGGDGNTIVIFGCALIYQP